METSRLNVAIIGCGLIGAQWDAEDTSPAFSLTHAAGFSKNPRAQLAAMCDQDAEKARRAAERWGAQASYSDPHALFAGHKIDVAVVAVSSLARWEVIEPALAAGVKVLVIEKPLATTLDESRKLASAIDAAGARSIINFSRHWDPSMRALRERICAGDMGTLQRLVGTYGKGVTNNGSHMIDLCTFLCDAKPMRARSLGSPLDAAEAGWSSCKDRAWDAQVEFERKDGSRVQLTMLATDQSAFTCFELRLIGRQAICEMSKGGRSIAYTEIGDDPNYVGYRIPGEAVPQPARALEAMDLMVDEVLRLAAGEIQASSCDADNALLTALTVEAINRSAQGEGRWQEIAFP
jgi:predicted dehydrogenase